MKPYVLSRNDAFSVSSPRPGGEEDEWSESGDKKDKEDGIDDGSQTQEEDNESATESEVKETDEKKDNENKTEESKVTNDKEKKKDEEKQESKIRVVASLATDPALRTASDTKSDGVERGIESPVSSPPLRSPSVPTPLASPLPPIKTPLDTKEAKDYFESLPPAIKSAIAAGRFSCFPPGDPSRGKAPDIPDARPGLGYICNPCGIRFSSASTLEAHQTYYCSHRQSLTDTPRNSGGDSESEEVAAAPMDTKSEDIKSVSSDPGTDPVVKSIRTGKQYKCPHCSYSADKKVSLNRHMRMHSSSPIEESSAPSTPLIDRYCQDCDIRFSSLKTFRAHKTHYCGSRHGPGPGATSVPKQTRSPSPPQPPKPFLVIPTSPVLIIPYSLVQSASLISGSAAANITTTDTASILLADGSLQPLPLALAGHHPPLDKATPTVTFPSPENKVVKGASEGVRKVDVHGREVSSPLDLSYRRSAEREMSLDLEDKENRRTVQGRSPQTPEHEDIICAPSIPLILSTSSTCSSPSPSPLSPALSSSSHSSKKFDNKKARTDSVCNSPSPKSSAVSPSPKSPRSTPNGVVKHRIEEKKKSESPIKPDPSISLQNLLLAAVAQNQMDISKGEYPRLPIPPELVPHLLSRLPEGKTLPGLPLRPGDPALLPYLAPELALNLPPPPPPHVIVKQGESKCNECNIVFYRIENFVAHKMYYCSANAASTATKIPEEKPISPPTTTSPKDAASKEPAPSTSKLPVYQFICAACGIKFTSYDNLTAHQTYYCPKRTNLEQDKPRKCAKCKVVAGPDHQCQSGSGTPGLGVGWKCPCCPVTSATAAQAQKHMESHSGVKAFLCTICRYKGNTLRGMRTHIRMHFDKKPADINEESYISCIIEEPSPTKMEIDENRKDDSSSRDSLNGEPIRVKEEEPDPLTNQVICLSVKPEEPEEHIDVDSVKSEVNDEPPDLMPDDLSTNNNRKSPRYCKSCDISFNYLSTFIAHKRFYCPSHVFENSDNNNSGRHTGTPVS